MTRLKFVMDSRGIKPVWLAEKVGISRQSMYLYREGTRIPAEVALNIADVLDIAPREILGEVEENVACVA